MIYHQLRLTHFAHLLSFRKFLWTFFKPSISFVFLTFSCNFSFHFLFLMNFWMAFLEKQLFRIWGTYFLTLLLVINVYFWLSNVLFKCIDFGLSLFPLISCSTSFVSSFTSITTDFYFLFHGFSWSIVWNGFATSCQIPDPEFDLILTLEGFGLSKDRELTCFTLYMDCLINFCIASSEGLTCLNAYTFCCLYRTLMWSILLFCFDFSFNFGFWIHFDFGASSRFKVETWTLLHVNDLLCCLPFLGFDLFDFEDALLRL